MKSVLILMFAILVNSCGKDVEAGAVADNECGYRMIAGRDCIVCEKGGVSCRWD